MWQLRRAGLTDIASLQAIRHRVTEYPADRDRPDTLYARYLSRTGRGWLGGDRQGDKGFVIVSLSDAAIWALYVDPVSQGQGLGRILLQQGCRYLFWRGAREVHLQTDANTAAMGFYQHLGWRIEQQHETGQVSLMLPRPVSLRRVLP
ncbi:GNAT family N-acetyltransferase [Ferrimonas balearica]|uniref:GNAT family N-acetyltransferase n=1 Tax=Ferrimonas balearica TaxID=44012 RepID=UPI001C993682|nr:GNAT family N-acetyltransferase [Ferrimonas balearica]MBY5920726.1 GNAT family N-acetyltransferase [Ferrimonas balearica]MBY5996589.1 GNAT family N-acetyltransferase [Ferrimonas balearica]